MKAALLLTGVVMAAAVTAGLDAQGPKAGTFAYDAAFVAKKVKTVVLKDGDARVLVVPAYQGRVMTSSAAGDAGASYGWLNYPVIEKGVLPSAQVKGRMEDHIYVFGGEERFWLGPEGGQYAIYFAPGAKFEFDAWHTPALIDSEPFDLVSATDTEAVFKRAFSLTNYSKTTFDGRIDRTVRLLKKVDAARRFGVTLGAASRAVCYETDNRLTNTGKAPWTKDKGLLSIWLLGMYKPAPTTTIVIPFKSGDDAALGPKVNDTYFGKVPADYLVVKDDVLFMRADGTRRGKIGISPRRSKGIAGSYDAESRTLTLVTYNVQDAPAGYVNSMWELQKDPFGGDVLNAYNDGSPGPGQPPLGPFYEIETSSPAAALAPGATMMHVSTTLHVQGPEAELDVIAKTALGVSLAEIRSAFKK